MTTTTPNQALAAAARELAASAPRGSIDRPAALCSAVCLETTRTAEAARKALADIGPANIRARAAEILDQLLDRSEP